MSNEAKFTKGEWEVSFCSGRASVWSGDESITNGKAYEYPCEDYRAEKMANAHLIKTAPKLYAMLDSLVNGKEPDLLFEMQTEIEELLAEARGEHEED